MNIRKMMKRIMGFSLLAALLPFAVIWLPKHDRDFYYKEFTYQFLVKQHLQGVQSERDKLIRLMELVHHYDSPNSNANRHAFNPQYALRFLDQTPYEALMRGVGSCDVQAYTLMNLLNYAHIGPTRLIDVQAHTAMEAKIDGKWVLVDPYFDAIFVNQKLELASIEEVQQNFGKGVYALTGKLKDGLIPDPRTLLHPHHLYVKNSIRWPDGRGDLYRRFRRFHIAKNAYITLARLSLRLYGNRYAYWLQDHYLKSLDSDWLDKIHSWRFVDDPIAPKEAFREYFLGRNYELYGRNQLSKESYKKLSTRYPDTFWGIKGNLYRQSLLEENV